MLACAAASAQDIERGKLLYELHCATCHTERLHAREKSKIKTYVDLRAEVELRARQTGRKFDPGEIEDVIEFLDASHYRLAGRPRKPG